MFHRRIASTIMCRARPTFRNFQRLLFESTFVPEAHKKILKVLNDVESVKDLQEYSISKASATKLFELRNDKGSFNSLDDPLAVVSTQALSKFYKSIVKDPQSIVTPTRNAVSYGFQLNTPLVFHQALSIVTAGTTIAWCLTQRDEDSKKLHIEQVAVNEIELKPRTHFLTVLNSVKSVVENIPKSELYVFEELTTHAPSPHLYNFALQRVQLRSFIMGLISSRKESFLSSVKTLAIGRLFKLHVGNERVSGQLILEGMLNNREEITINELVRGDYVNGEPAEREHMANAILLNIGYWKLFQQRQVLPLVK